MPLFSVIIPAFNRAAMIQRTIRSVLDQPGEPIQIIVVDDGSTDGTPEAVRQFGSRVTLLQQENRGPGVARNTGLAAATSDYVAFLDSDDFWFPWSAQTYAQVIDRYRCPAFIAGKPFLFTHDSDPAPTLPDPLTCQVFDDYYASGDQWRWYSASSFVMRRDLLLAVGGFTSEWINGEDADAAMRMGVAGTFVQVTSPCSFGYRRHATSAMSNFQRSLAGISRLVDQEARGHFPGGASRALARRRIICSFTRPLCIASLERGHTEAAWMLFQRTFTWNLNLGRWRFLAGFLAKAAVVRWNANPQSAKTT